MMVKDKFQEYLDYLKKDGFSAKTITEQKRYLHGSLAHSVYEIPIDNLYLTDVAKVKEAGKDHGTTGPQRSVSVFRCYMRYLQESGTRLNFDYRDIQVPSLPHKMPDYLSQEEFDRLREILDENRMEDLRTRAVIEVLYATGMRIGELVALNKEDIDWESKEGVITNSKTKDQEKVYFTDNALYWLKKYLDRRRDDLPYLFVTGRNRALPVTIRNYLRVHRKRAGITRRIYPHLFRKTFVTDLLRGHANIKEVQYLARHKSERTTLQSYASVVKEEVKATHERILNHA